MDTVVKKVKELKGLIAKYKEGVSDQEKGGAHVTPSPAVVTLDRSLNRFLLQIGDESEVPVITTRKVGKKKAEKKEAAGDDKTEKPEKEEKLEVIKEYYGYNNTKATEALRLLTDEQYDVIQKRLNKGGKT